MAQPTEGEPLDPAARLWLAPGELREAPDSGTVIVRSGSDWGVDNDTWLAVFRDLADQLRQGAER